MRGDIAIVVAPETEAGGAGGLILVEQRLPVRQCARGGIEIRPEHIDLRRHRCHPATRRCGFARLVCICARRKQAFMRAPNSAT